MPELPARILIVDDKAFVRNTISETVGDIGYRVRTAQDGLSALREIRLDIPDILIADLHMPRMSGFELLRVVRRRFPAALVIAMSGALVGDEVPPGVLADAFYHKGGSLAPLLKIIATPPRINHRDCRLSLVPSPDSKLHTVQRSSVDGAMTTDCTDCGRPATLATGGPARLTCKHCGNSMDYAIAEQPQQTLSSHNGSSDPRDIRTSRSVRRQA